MRCYPYIMLFYGTRDVYRNTNIGSYSSSVVVILCIIIFKTSKVRHWRHQHLRSRDVVELWYLHRPLIGETSFKC